MTEGNRTPYPLEAWVKGHYARDCGKSQEECPYKQGTSMAIAWQRGWWHREQSETAKTSGARASG